MKTFLHIPTLLLFFSTFYLQSYSQNKIDHNDPPNFESQGQQENYWATQFFQEHYTTQNLNRFKGEIVKGEGVFVFTSDSLFVNSSNEMKNIFISGLIYPTLLSGNYISDIEELTFLSQPPHKKRYRFLLFQKGMANSRVCFFELTNSNAKLTTDLSEFLLCARLTFFKTGWTMI